MRVQPLSRLHSGTPLHRDVDRNSHVGIPAVEKVVTVVDIGDINVVVVIPVISPILRPWVNETDPIPLILEARISAHNQEGQAVDTKAMVRSKVSTEALVRDAVAVVATTLLPVAVLGIPVLGPMLPP